MALRKEEMNFKQMTDNIDEPLPIVTDKANSFSFNSYARGYILTNSPDKVSQSGVIDLGLSDHDLIYCARETSLPKSHKHNEIFVLSLKRYSAEKFLEILREIVFPKLSDLYWCG